MKEKLIEITVINGTSDGVEMDYDIGDREATPEEIENANRPNLPENTSGLKFEFFITKAELEQSQEDFNEYLNILINRIKFEATRQADYYRDKK